MLNLEQIAARIAQPELCQREELRLLKDLTDKYPYAQIFSIIYLKALSIHHDIHFEDELSQHAYRITDRSQLFELIHSNPKIISSTEIIESTHVPVEPILAPELTILRPEPIEIIQAEPEVIPIEIPEVDQEIKIETSTPLIEMEEKIEIEAQEIISFEENKEETLSTETKIDQQEENEGNVVASDSHIEQFEKEIISQAIVSAYAPIRKENPVIEEETINLSDPLQLEEEKEIEVNDGQKSFTSWLRSNINETLEINEDKVRIDNLVDQFIRETPSITRPAKETQEEKPKKEFYSAAKKAKESLDSTSMPVSETLAKIFALQGNYPKAIYAYEQLMLSNPEKKIFFASQIDELKKKLNS